MSISVKKLAFFFNISKKQQKNCILFLYLEKNFYICSEPMFA